jgi:hypothetical protein
MSPAIVVDERLRKDARAVRDREPLFVVLRLTAPAARTIAALKEIAASWPEEETDNWRGQWHWIRTGEGVVLAISKSLDVVRELDELRDCLTGMGLAGRLTAYRAPKLPEWTGGKYALEAVLRVGRHNDEAPGGWDCERDALEAVVCRAVRWCFDDRPGVPPILAGAFVPDLVLDPDEDPVERMVEALFGDPDDVASGATMLCISEIGTRAVRANKLLGEVVLTDRPVVAKRRVWRAPYKRLRALVFELAPQLAYGLVRHSSNPTADSFLAYDGVYRELVRKTGLAATAGLALSSR